MSKRSNFQNYIEYYALVIVIFFIRLLGRKIAQKAGAFFAGFTYYFIPVRKKHVIEMLKDAFPEKSLKDVKAITKNAYKSFISTIIDIMFFPKMSDEQIMNMMVYDEKGMQVIENAYNQNKGTVLMSAHFGNWELTALSFSKKYPMSVIVAKQSNDLVDRMMNNIRTKQGFKTICKDDVSSTVRSVMKALKKNEFVAILSDQDAGKQGVFVPFFGKLASTPKGAALFALRAQCPLVTAFGIKQKDGKMKMKISEIKLPNTGNQDEDIRIINAQYSKQLEEVVRIAPQQWFWFHKKWKTRPEKETE